MSENEETGERRDGDGPALLVGASRRCQELGAVLSALASLRNGTGRGGASRPSAPREMGDLEELLANLPSAGRLVLDVLEVPPEDIGFVRRFLERNPAWELLLLGVDERAPTARYLLGLPRTHWIQWPPHLDELSGLLPPGDPGDPGGSGGPGAAPSGGRRPKPRSPAPSARAAAPAPTPEPRRAPEDDEDDFDGAEPAPRATAPAAEVAPSPAEVQGSGPQASVPAPGPAADLDLAALVEELIAGAALDPSAPRYLFRAEAAALVGRDRASLVTPLEGLLALARHAAGASGVVGLQVDAAGLAGDPEDTARLRLDFPADELPRELRADALDRPLPKVSNLPRELAKVLRGARRAASALRALGARVELRPHKEGKLRVEVFVAGQPLPEAPAEGGRGGKPEDPFA